MPFLTASFALAIGACTRPQAAPAPWLVDCLFNPLSAATSCPVAEADDAKAATPLAPAADLVLRSVAAERTRDDLTLDVALEGNGFWNAADQNVYVFVGDADGGSVRYALSADSGFAADIGYPIRSAAQLSHALDLRVGAMAPTIRSYTPQVFFGADVKAAAVGEPAGVQVRCQGPSLQLEIPIARYYASRGAPVPAALGVTVATARDYVGFVDQIAIDRLSVDGRATATAHALPPERYPDLDPASHIAKTLTLLTTADEGARVELETAAPISDWAQTNLSFFFLPVPPSPLESPIPEPSGARIIPYRWSYYCGVYSPHRIFCKASRGKDFRYDGAYAERASLAPPEGVAFAEPHPGRYRLTLDRQRTEIARGGRDTFAVMVVAARDGNAPSRWYGTRKPLAAGGR